MSPFASRFRWCCLCALLALYARPVSADLVKLKSGGELRGVFVDKVVTAPGRGSNVPVRVETLTGGIITVSHEDVAFLAKRNRNLEEYEWRSRLAPQTVAAHWELQEWCKQRGMKKERDEELQQIVGLDPENEAARRLLGHIRQDGKWMSRDEAMAAKGYVKHKGKYVFPQEVALLEASALHKEAETAWHKKLHVWQNWLHDGNPSHDIQARRELEAISDPDAVGPLVRMFRNDSSDDIRLLFVRVLGRLQVPPAIHAMVLQSLFDASPTVRAAAMEGITGEGRTIASPIYCKALSDELNVVVLRSAVALGHFGNPEVVPSLIEALVTTHTYRQTVEDRGYLAQGAIAGLPQGQITTPPPNISLNIPGIPVPLSLGSSPYQNGGQSTTTTVPIPNPVSRQRTVIVTRQEQNLEVLAALRKLTREDFGYDERTWRLWWTTQRSTKSPAVEK
jgi:HEAT repeat protein